jgi:hypothetical protein
MSSGKNKYIFLGISLQELDHLNKLKAENNLSVILFTRRYLRYLISVKFGT